MGELTLEQVTIYGVKNREELKALLEGSRRTKLLNPADRECSPEVYVHPREARLANIIGNFLASVRDCDIEYKEYDYDD